MKREIDISNERERDNTDSFDDSHRKELLWETREESLIIKWQDDCFIRSDLHNVKAKRNKYLYTCFGTPTVMIPVILGGLSGIIQCHSISYSIIMMVSALFNATLMFFNFGKKQSDHSNYANLYTELSHEIESELCKPKSHRPPCEVFLEKIKSKYTNLIKTSPDI